ncbi:MAG: hypothetical protein ACLFPL_00815 [Candidatus Nanoarchaeia archaeon]
MIKRELDLSFHLDPKQEELYSQLENIGEEIATFYLDALKIINNSEIKSKVNLVAHLAREMDGSLRNIFSETPDEIKCESCNQKINNFSHKNSIYSALNLNPKEEDEFAEKWFSTARKFHGFAHRSGAWKKTKDFESFESYWKEFEEILFELSGSYLNLLNNFDNLLDKEEPNKVILNTLENLLKIEARENYFFRELKKTGWLEGLNNRNYFDPKNIPKPIEFENGWRIHIWKPIKYLEFVSEKLNDDNLDLFMKILNKIIEHREGGNIIDNNNTNYSILKILSNIPADKLEEKHIIFIKETYNSNFENSLISAEIGKSFLPILIDSNRTDLVLKLLKEVILRFMSNERFSFKNFSPVMENYWFVDLFKNNLEYLLKVSHKDLILLSTEKINELINEEENCFHISNFPNLNNLEIHSLSNSYENILLNVLVKSIELKSDNLENDVKLLLKTKKVIFVRVGLFLIDKHYDYLKEIFWELDDNFIENHDLKHELYKLIKNNAIKFTEIQINKIIENIESAEYYIYNEEIRDKILAYKKKEWFEILIPTQNKLVKQEFDKYNKINPNKNKMAGLNFKISDVQVGEAKPLSQEKFNCLEIEDIIKYLNEFKQEEGFGNPSYRGLGEILEQKVINDSNLISENINKFEKMPNRYLPYLFRGFINSSKDKNKFNWEKILNFLNNVIKKEKFWSELTEKQQWFQGEFSNLLEEGLKNENNLIPEYLLNLVKNILLNLSKHEFYFECKSDDTVTFALNSNQGKLISAILFFVFREYNLRKIFNPEIKEYFEEKLKENKFIEINSIIAGYLSQFITIDIKWIEYNFHNIFPRENSKFLKASLDGYFFNNLVYKKSFELIKNKNLYEYLIENFKDWNKNIKSKLTEHIILAFLEDWEDETNVNKLLSFEESVETIIRYIWLRNNKEIIDKEDKVKNIWNLINLKYKSDCKIMSQSLKLLCVFNKLDDDLVQFSLNSTNQNNTIDFSFIIEYLEKFVKESPNSVGNILLRIVENSEDLYDYKKEIVIEIVLELYRSNEKKLADKICNLYAQKHQIYFLREIYNSQSK